MADELATLERIQRKVLWLATWMIHRANARPSADGTKVGGHQASSASVVGLLTALYFKALRPDDRVAVKAHAAPAFYAIQYLRGRLPRSALAELRSFGGLQAYPSRRKNPEIVDLSTGSMGLGAVQATLGALASRYVADHFGVDPPGRVIVMAGDAELDEGNGWEGLAEEAVGGRGRVLWVVDVKRQGRGRAGPDPPTPQRGATRRGRRGRGRGRAAERHPRPHDQGLGAATRWRSAEPHDAPDRGPDHRAARRARDRAGRRVGWIRPGER